MENTEKEKRPERALLAAVDTGDYDAEASLHELAQLADTAGMNWCAARGRNPAAR